MSKTDARKLDHKTREAIRIRAVQRVEAGESPEVVIQSLGYHRSCIYEWIGKYREGGLDALKTRKITGRKSKISGKQLQKLYKIISDGDPRQYKFPFALWTRGMVREVICKEFGIRLSEVSVGRLLKKLGFTPQRPLRKAYQKNEQLVNDWVNKEYPTIQKLAKNENATIYFGDEASIRSDYHSGTTWAPKGQTPVVKKTGARFSVNMISAICPKGKLRFMTVDGRMNSEIFITFLKRLLYGSDNPIFLIVDNHPVHKSKAVKAFIESTKGKLRLFYLPPYSPDLNPDELVWRHVKYHKIGKDSCNSKHELLKKAISLLKGLQRMPSKIIAYFKQTHSGYAAI